MALKDLQVNIGADTTGFNKGIKNVQSGTKKYEISAFSAVQLSLLLRQPITAISVASVKLMKAYAGLRNSVQRTNELFKGQQ